jgi:hypothetical protein
VRCTVISDEDIASASLDDLHRFADSVGIGYGNEDAEGLRNKIRFNGISPV